MDVNSDMTSRRNFLMQAGGGIGSIALAHLLGEDRAHAAGSSSPAHFAPRAKRVIWLFMHGGPAHMELWDPKPELKKYAGKKLPPSFGSVKTRRKVAGNSLLPALKPFRPCSIFSKLMRSLIL